MFEIPGHGFLQPTRQGATHGPAELAFGLGGIDRVAKVMTRSVIDETDLTRVAAALRARFKPIKNAAQRLDQRNVVHVGAGAEQIFFAGPPALTEPQQAVDVIIDVKPVPAIAAIAIDWDRRESHRMPPLRWYKLFGQLEGLLICGADR